MEAFRAATESAGVSKETFPFPDHLGLYEVVSEQQRVSTDAPSVTPINLFEVPPGADAEFVRSWEAARDLLGRAPGYLGTRLHRSIGPDADFRFINVARWATPEAFRAAVADLALGAPRAPYTSHPGLYQQVHVNSTAPMAVSIGREMT